MFYDIKQLRIRVLSPSAKTFGKADYGSTVSSVLQKVLGIVYTQMAPAHQSETSVTDKNSLQCKEFSGIASIFHPDYGS